MPNWKFLAAGVFAAFALVLSVLAVAAAALRPGWAIGPGGGLWWQPTPGNHLFGVAVVVAWGLAWLSFSVGRGVRTFRPRDWLVLQAALTLAYGFASYGPCLGDSNVISVPMWVLNLFVGQVEQAALGPAPAACPGEYPLAFQVARLLGIGTTALGGVAFLASLSRGLLDRVWVWWASDLDVVVGLNERSVPLIESLVAQRQRERRVRPWYAERWWEWVLRRLPTIGGGVVVVRRDRDDPLLGEVEALGVRVIVGDPQDPELHRLAMRRIRRGQVAVRRLFAVADSQERNAATVGAALTALSGFARSTSGAAWLEQEFVPRLVARFDDARESRAFRLNHLDVPGCFVDAISSDELLARELVARFRADRADTAVLVGDSPLTVALLDELALRGALAALPRDDGTAAPAGVAPPPASVAVCAPTASQIKAEWETLGPADLAARPLELTACTGDWEDVVAGLRSDGRRVAVVVTRDDGQALSRALRVNRLHPSASVYCWTPTASGVEVGTDGVRGVVRIGPTLLQRGGVPEDSWGVLAGAVHDRNRDPASPRPADRAWGDPIDDPETRLPDFYREDTLRRQRWVLQLVAQQGYAWRPRQPWDADPTLPEKALASVARREHDRWCQWRLTHRWRWAPASADRLAMDRARQNANLVGWDTGNGRPDGAGLAQTDLAKLIKRNNEDVSKVLTHLYHWGVVPGRLYQRTGIVHATRLTAARSWTTQDGSSLTVASGDWWVEDLDPDTGQPRPDTGRGVAAAEFPKLHQELDAAAGRYQRRGTVTAVRLGGEATVRSLEGSVHAQPGTWVVTDSTGNSWAVPASTFMASYEEVPAVPGASA